MASHVFLSLAEKFILFPCGESSLRTKGLHPDWRFIILRAISYSWRASLFSPGELFYLPTEFLFLPMEYCPHPERPCLEGSFSQRSWSSFQESLPQDFPKSFLTMVPGAAGLERGEELCQDQPFALHCSVHLRAAGSHLRDRHLCPFPSGARAPLIPLTLSSLLPLHRLPQNIYSFQNHMKPEQQRNHKNLIFCSLFYLIILQLGFKGLNYLSCFITFIMTFCTVPPAPQRQ